MTSAAAPYTSDDLIWFKSSHSSDQGGACLEVAYTWRKSSYSASAGGNCLEVAADWRKSSHSGDEGGNCLEVATCPSLGDRTTTIHIRDSKNPDGPVLTLPAGAWGAFVADVVRP
ncbi:DUF397 domain-containing protein [Streptomyces sp. NPDC004296]|uniref:DUF397 domain-containing protein n=1 Tax=Streptomyces sp. NPDC004296 TaxID=3364697 RepID=UPI00369E9B77